MDRVFQAASAAGIPGKDLFLEHLHPNFNGYRLMAQTFFDVLKRIQIINPPKRIGWRRELLYRPYINQIIKSYQEEDGNVTALDLEFGYLRNYILTSRWPFPFRAIDLKSYKPVGSEMTKNLAADHVQDKMFWDEAHYQLGDYFLEQKEYRLALAEYRAVNLAFYDNPVPFKKIGALYEKRGLYPRAIDFYKRSLERKKNDPQLQAQLGRLMAVENRFQEARTNLQEALHLGEENKIFTREQTALIHYLLAVCEGNLEQWENAHTHLRQALKINPDLQAAKELEQQMDKMQMKEDRP
jgi:tetratricopeptide (TPR) repeat protein